MTSPTKMSDEALTYTIKDLMEVIEAQEAMAKVGHRTDKLNTYRDELSACGMEKRRRTTGGLHSVTLLLTEAQELAVRAMLSGEC